MRLVLLAGVSLLCACSDPGKDAEKHYEMVERTGNRGEICDAGKAVVNAYLKSGNEEKYKRWHSIVDVNCLNARLDGPNGRPNEYVVETVQ